jgi:enoyl-CoA hydratase/3-hydroxyacyl-CoA dehydrogenase
MEVGVIGSGSIGPDLAYGFITALAKGGGGTVRLLDVKQEALDAGMARIRGYVKKGLVRGKLSPKVAEAVEKGLVPTLDMNDLAGCEYVLEAATENLDLKRRILADLEKVVSPECLIGFATSGIPRRKIAAGAAHPERCFVNHPFFPAWRSLPIEVVLSDDAEYGDRMMRTLKDLGKVPLVTADVECFAADDVFVNYCAEAVRIHEEGLATPAQVDKIVNDAVGGGGPFNVMDLTRGNPLNVHCLELMRDAPTGNAWFEPPALLREQGVKPWHDRKNPGDPAHDEALKRKVLDRMLAVLLGRSFFVVDNGICHPREFNWMTRNALGFAKGLLDLAEDLGMERVHELCTTYAAANPGFHVTESVETKRMPDFYRNLEVERADGVAVVTVKRPEVLNALNRRTLSEIGAAMETLDADPAVQGVVLTGYNGSLAGADIMELAALETPEEAREIARFGHRVLARIAAMKKPVVAAVDGPVLGGGCEIAMACHARVVGPRLVLGQPEVNLGIVPGYGGTQRLPRIVGLEKALEMLRTARTVLAGDACAMGWAVGEPASDVVEGARGVIREHLSGARQIGPVDPAPMRIPAELPQVDIGHHSLVVDRILVDTVRRGVAKPLPEGLEVEAEGLARCKGTIDFDIGMKNFIQNGPRVPADFLHE